MPVFRFGNDNPAVAFVGPEEYLLGPVDRAMNLRAAAALPADRDGFHDLLATELEAIGHEDAPRAREACRLRQARTKDQNRPGVTNAWNVMARIVAALTGGTSEHAYQRLGRHGGNTLLLELFPLPKKGLQAWSDTHARLTGCETAATYFAQTWPMNQPHGERAAELAQVIAGLAPGTFVIQYSRGAGNEFWRRVQHLVPDVEFAITCPNTFDVGKTPQGLIVARTAAFSGQTKLSNADVGDLIEALRDVRGQPGDLPAMPLPPVTDAARIELRSNRRPTNYAELSAEERRRIDHLLGLIDPDTGIGWL